MDSSALWGPHASEGVPQKNYLHPRVKDEVSQDTVFFLFKKTQITIHLLLDVFTEFGVVSKWFVQG